MASRFHSSWTAFLITLVASIIFSTTSAQNSTSNSTTQSGTFDALFDSASYSDGAGANNPTVVAINTPEGDNQTDLFIHFSAPAENHAWAAFGLGDGMTDSLIFVVYRSDSNSSAVTISPRLGTGHSMPKFTSDVQVKALDLTGVDANNRFVVNMQCTNCRSWNGGDLQVMSGSKAVSQPVFYALGPNGDLSSDDTSASISIHERHSDITGLALVPGPAGVPIVTDDPSEPRTNDGGLTNGGSGTASGGDSDGGSGPFLSLAFHAFFMCFAFALVFPGGYLLLRMFERVWLHWIPQTIGVLCVIAGFGAGIRATVRGKMGFGNPHQILGFVIVFIILSTWTLGMVGHRIYKKTQIPSPLMRVHRILGPLSILLGFANACVGFAWAGMTRTILVYAIFNVLVAAVVGGLVFWKRRRTIRKGALNSAAASNFREGATDQFAHGPPIYVGSQQPHYQEQHDVPMYNIRPNK